MSDGWHFIPHACRACLGRLLEREGVIRCAECGAEARGGPELLCGCGISVEGARAPVGFRCEPNPSRGPANPAEIVIVFGNDSPSPTSPGALAEAA
jgi:hypothetical protein